jgi:hypothetical protein
LRHAPPEQAMLEKVLRAVHVLLFSLVGGSLLLLAFALLAASLTGVITDIHDGEFRIYSLLNRISGVVISVAVLDLGKFILDEEIIRGRDLRSTSEVRISVTKFMTIILIAMSLEALVMVFKVSTSDDFSTIVYPSILLTIIVFALIAIGVFQLLTRKAEQHGAAE